MAEKLHLAKCLPIPSPLNIFHSHISRGYNQCRATVLFASVRLEHELISNVDLDDLDVLEIIENYLNRKNNEIFLISINSYLHRNAICSSVLVINNS